jgi:thioester reductase-like protein
VSTAYVAGDAAGVVTEPPREPHGPFRNTNEQSKWEAEQVVHRASDVVPTTISRPSIIVGDSRTGATPHFRVLYEPMKWIYFNSRGDGASFTNKRADVLPCRPDVRLDAVPVDHVADHLVALTFADATAVGVFHVSAGPAHALTIEQTVDVMLEAGNRMLEARGRPPVPRPTIVSPEMLDGSSELRELFALGEELMSAYMPYGLREQLFDPAGTDDALGGALAECPDPRTYYPVLVEYATANDYGRQAR